MPPSTIPREQVQAIIAELRGADSGADIPGEQAERAVGAVRGRMGAAVGLLVVGAMIGAAVGFLGPSLGLFERKAMRDTPPTALSVTAPVPVQAPASQASTQAAPPTPSVPPSAPRALATAQPTLRPPVALDTVESVKAEAPKPCLAGGPCGRADVQTAERRLQNAYRAAQRDGASASTLASARRRWNVLKPHAADKPRTTVAGYRKLSAELYAKTSKTRGPAPAMPYRRAR